MQKSIFDFVAPIALSAMLLTSQIGANVPIVGPSFSTVVYAEKTKAAPANLPKAAEDPVAMAASKRSTKSGGAGVKYEPSKGDTAQVSRAVATAKAKPSKPLSVKELKEMEVRAGAKDGRLERSDSKSKKYHINTRLTTFHSSLRSSQLKGVAAPPPTMVKARAPAPAPKVVEKKVAKTPAPAPKAPAKKKKPAPASAPAPIPERKLTTAQKKLAEKDAATPAPTKKAPNSATKSTPKAAAPKASTTPKKAAAPKKAATPKAAPKKAAQKKATTTATAAPAKKLTTAQQKQLAAEAKAKVAKVTPVAKKK